MYLPRSLISKLYIHLQNTRHPLSPPVLILVALEPDALCACRILTRLLKHDYIPHKIHPVVGLTGLAQAGTDLVAPMMESRGGSGGVVVCLGVGGMLDLGETLGLESEGDDAPYSGVEVWVMDARRPWNLGNVFGGFPLEPAASDESSYQSRCPSGVEGGQIGRPYKPGKGGIVVFDDGDIEEELESERDAYRALLEMPDIDDDGEELGLSDEDEDEPETSARTGQKRKSWSDSLDDESSDDEDDRPRQRRRSNSVSRPACPRTRDCLLTLCSPPRSPSLRDDPSRGDCCPCGIPTSVCPATLSSPHRVPREPLPHPPGPSGDACCACAGRTKPSLHNTTWRVRHFRSPSHP